MMDCLGMFLISSKAGFKQRAVAARPRSSWMLS